MKTKLDDLKEECIQISQEAYRRGLISATGGNISARLPGEETVIIKRTGASFRNLKLNDIITIDLNGNVVEGQGNKEKPEPQAATNMEKIIAECVEQVLKILQQKNER
ncbi:MAG: DUF5908 family protein [Bacteroidales bacterium]